MSEQKYRVRLENFEGPLDLLLHLIDKNKLDIYDIPIASITEQYLDFLAEAQQMDLDIASEFLLIAATLINIKVKMLLPKKKSEEEMPEVDPRAELVSRLLEYKFYKGVAAILKEDAQDASAHFLKEIDVSALAKDFAPTNPVANLSVLDLFHAFQKVILHVREEPPFLTLVREEYDVETSMAVILEMLEQHSSVLFTDLFAPADSRRKIVTLFLALLELYKHHQIVYRQKENFSAIWIFKGLLDSDCEVE